MLHDAKFKLIARTAATVRSEVRATRIERGLVALLASALCACAPHAPPKPKSAPELMQAAVACMQARDWVCAEETFAQYIKLRPNDSRAIANYGFALHNEGKDAAAIQQFEKAIGDGEGTYDLFAEYAASLGNVGRTDDAINWSYKALQLVPSLVDVRGNLAKLLVREKRYYEALTVLTEFDQQLSMEDNPPYFTGQRIAIESVAPHATQTGAATPTPLRTVEFNHHFFAPVRIGDAHVAAFIVDTGASLVTLNDSLMVASKARFTIVQPHALVTVADGSNVDAKLVDIDHIEVGAFELDHVRAIVCGTCSLLLGEDALSRLDVTQTRVEGIDALTLSARR